MVQCSDQYVECRIAEWLWKIVPMALLIIGTGGNIVNVIVLSRRAMRRYSTSVYLLVLAVSDTLGLWVILPRFSYRHIYDLDFLGLSYLHCKFSNWIGYSSAVVSTWTVVNLTIERLLLTMYPIKAKLRLTPQVSVWVSFGTILVVQFFTAHLLFSHTFLGSEVQNTRNFTRCVFASEEFRDFHKTTWNYIVLICFNLLPIAIIITGNAVIGTILLRRKRQIYPITNQISAAREKMALKMLFAISFFYIIFTSPYCFYAVIKAYSTPELSAKEQAVDQLVNAIIYMLLFSNLTFNFALYFARGSLFREEWNKIVNSLKIKIKLNKGVGRSSTFVGGLNESGNIGTIKTIT